MPKTLAILAALIVAIAPATADRASRDAQQAKDVAAGEAELAGLTKGLAPGKALSCLPPDHWGDSHNIDRVGILYGFGDRKYLARMDADCASFSFNDIPVIVSHGLICRGDFVRIVDSSSHFPKGACSLSDIIPYEKPKR